jgi:acetoin:2,6-dichlorophenolindophenol oxidoreductase subunit alpha
MAPESDRTHPLSLYRTMLLIRTFEDEIYRLFLKNLVPGTIHLYQGQEAVAAGVCANLKDDDIILSTHRSHGHALAKGITPAKVMSEIMGKATGCCKGKGGSMHVCDMNVGFPPALAIVGAGIPIAAGAALAFKMRGEKRISVSMFGDSATNTGAFHEGLTLAAVWNLPVIFICENNLYGVSTRIQDSSKLKDMAEHGQSYGIPAAIVDGNDVMAVSEIMGVAVERARNGNGPTLIEAKTYRHGGHSRSDPGQYRPAEEKETWLKKDPIPFMRDKIIEQNIANQTEIQEIHDQIRKQIDQAVTFSVESPYPEPASIFEDVLKGVV